MKKLFFIASMVILCNLSDAQIKMNSSGNVAIGTNASSWKLYVLGSMGINGSTQFYQPVTFTPAANGSLIIETGGYYYSPVLRPSSNYSCNLGKSDKAFAYVYSYNYPSPSDARQKENFHDIEDALNTVLQLNAVKYDIKKEYIYLDSIQYTEEEKTRIEADRKNRVGFLAQDVYNIIPAVVYHDDSTDMYSIDYSKIVPYLAEAIKEQQAIIEDLKIKIEEKDKLKSTEAIPDEENESNLGIDEPYLEQNVPNPFNTETLINFYLPDEVSKSLLNIYDMQGLQIKSYCITERGNSSVIINASELLPGMYLYTLIVDNKEIDTKRMILTD